MKTTNPIVKGLVLAGGQSRRMGRDKGLLEYHGKPQREYLYHQLQPLCSEVYLSLRPGQESDLPDHLPYILDENLYRGPFNGLLSAHHKFPDAAWLVVACDLPMMDTAALRYLLERRNPQAPATAFATQETGLPEPMAALWEPSGLQQAIGFLEQGESTCPRKFLIRQEASLVNPEDDLWLANANAPEDYEALMAKMGRL
ncbi:molybdenum cofactor guanylyltransferase [Robiginitalea sp. M366]|uniref:molybdenum cofactor guanylyltransferase n=1 Tax=Robiginitalea aestuariiviva TaxID=3036903 RepID=UPI00240D18EE|nr:molybdenum cofactor guanylyltransferase [Robiginitalea aestuariiviva]MDG1572923.1 molybdenum cofactor guanylyltransferase [Robiginitalea aestuariiviva]